MRQHLQVLKLGTNIFEGHYSAYYCTWEIFFIHFKEFYAALLAQKWCMLEEDR